MNWLAGAVAIAQSCNSFAHASVNDVLDEPPRSLDCRVVPGAAASTGSVTVSAGGMIRPGAVLARTFARNGGLPGTGGGGSGGQWTLEESATVHRRDGNTGELWAVARRPFIYGSTFSFEVPGNPDFPDTALSGTMALGVGASFGSWGGGVAISASLSPSVPGYWITYDTLSTPVNIQNNRIHIGLHANANAGVSFGPNIGDQLAYSGAMGIGWGGIDFYASDPRLSPISALVPIEVDAIGDQSGCNYTNPFSVCLADLTNDGLVEDADFVAFVSAYNLLDCTDTGMTDGCLSDLNNDLVVDDADFVLFVGAYDQLICE